MTKEQPDFADDSGDEILGEVQFIEENDGELRDAHRMIELDERFDS